jgi:DNA-directed RNA polymerase subunit H
MKSKEIIDHFMVPKHEILSQKEIKVLKEQYKTELNKFPKIFVSDPAIKNINAKVGDIIKITRYSPTANTTIYYRQVIEKYEYNASSEFDEIKITDEIEDATKKKEIIEDEDDLKNESEDISIKN